MCIVTITVPVQIQVIERSCVLLPLHYLYTDSNGNNTHVRSFSWLCTGSVMATMHMTAHFSGFEQVFLS
jgi:hypothetical protein